MSNRELAAWQVFAKHEPIGADRTDYQTALIAYTISVNAQRRKGRGPRFEKFIPRWWRREQEPNDMLAMAKALTTAMGGTVGPNVDKALAEDADGDGAREADGDPWP